MASVIHMASHLANDKVADIKVEKEDTSARTSFMTHMQTHITGCANKYTAHKMQWKSTAVAVV